MTEVQATTPTVMEPPAPTPVAAPVAVAPATPGKTFCWGTGRRKSSIARVRIRHGDGKFMVNDREFDDFFKVLKDRHDVVAPLKVNDAAKKVDVFVNVCGGGISGQAGAIMLGLARALCKLNADYEGPLRDNGLLTRDSREVERKKYGQSGARRRFQFSKR